MAKWRKLVARMTKHMNMVGDHLWWGGLVPPRPLNPALSEYNRKKQLT